MLGCKTIPSIDESVLEDYLGYLLMGIRWLMLRRGLFKVRCGKTSGEMVIDFLQREMHRYLFSALSGNDYVIRA